MILSHRDVVGGGAWGSSPECLFKTPESFGLLNSVIKNMQNILNGSIPLSYSINKVIPDKVISVSSLWHANSHTLTAVQQILCSLI